MGESHVKIHAVKPEDGDWRAVTIFTAYRVAAAYFESGLRDYQALHAVFISDEAGPERKGFDDFLRYAVPAATNLCFAVEIHLKVLIAQQEGRYGSGHPIDSLYDMLRPEQKASLQRRFVESCAADQFRYLTEYAVQFRESVPAEKLEFLIRTVDDTGPDLADPDCFVKEIRTSSNLYSRWRYLYELDKATDLTTVRFFSLIHINKALAAEIGAFSGGVAISLDGSQG